MPNIMGKCRDLCTFVNILHHEVHLYSRDKEGVSCSGGGSECNASFDCRLKKWSKLRNRQILNVKEQMNVEY